VGGGGGGIWCRGLTRWYCAGFGLPIAGVVAGCLGGPGSEGGRLILVEDPLLRPVRCSRTGCNARVIVG